jgi:two-component system response regulator (stage 0 sporulation protein A)
MKKCRFYIADMDVQFVSAVRRVIAQSPSIEILGSTGNGRVALTESLRLKPDVVMTDIPLPDLDGISLLHELQRFRRAPAVIVCTRFYSEAIIECACRYRAAFLLCKPIEISTLPELILECGRSRADIATAVEKAMTENEAERFRGAVVLQILKDFGMSARLNGTAYFLEAVVYCYGDVLLMKNLSKGLYAQLAQRMDTTVSRVERSMRSAIAIAYERGSLSRRFPHRPTNREFIEYLMNAVEQAENNRNK